MSLFQNSIQWIVHHPLAAATLLYVRQSLASSSIPISNSEISIRLVGTDDRLCNGRITLSKRGLYVGCLTDVTFDYHIRDFEGLWHCGTRQCRPIQT